MKRCGVVVTSGVVLVCAFSFATYVWGQGSPSRLFAQETHAPQPVQRAPGTKRCSPDCDQLLVKARQKGSTSIIVVLVAPDLPRLARPEAPIGERRRSHEARKQAVAQAQQSFLLKLASHKLNKLRAFAYLPHVSMEVDAATLEAILSYPEVRSVSENSIAR
jgi:hypothetical protein